MSRNLVVSKFGGSSMADTVAMKRSAGVSLKQQSAMVVVSATYGTTNMILESVELARSGDWDKCLSLVAEIKQKHRNLAQENALDSEERDQLEKNLSELETLCQGIKLMRECSPRALDRIQSLGERMSSLIFRRVFQNLAPEKDIRLMDARHYLKTDDRFTKATPDIRATAEKCAPIVEELQNENVIYVTQGFIASTMNDETTTLGRGGSDYSAALLAEAIGANKVEIWTDVAGIATTDPRICPKAQIIPEITFQEAAELAVFGAKILHPTTLTPARRSDIAVFVGSSYEPEKDGTWIRPAVDASPLVRALAMRKNQAILTLTTPKMLAYGFLFEIFKIFNQHKVSVDAVTTSEISVCMTVDQDVLGQKELLQDLRELAEVKVEEDLTLVSLVGNRINHTSGLAKDVFSSLEGINVRMICQGASLHNFCFLVKADQGVEALRRLHRRFLETSE